MPVQRRPLGPGAFHAERYCARVVAARESHSAASTRARKTFLFACIDDHSRLITGARFYLRENVLSERSSRFHAGA